MPDDAAYSLRYQLFAVITAIKIHLCYLALFLVISIDTGTAAGCNIAFDWYRVGPLLLYRPYYITYIIFQWQMVSTSLRSEEGSQSSQQGDCGHVCGHVRDGCYELPLAASDPNQINRGLDATFLFSVDCSADCGLTQIRTSCGKLLRLTRQISNVPHY